MKGYVLFCARAVAICSTLIIQDNSTPQLIGFDETFHYGKIGASCNYSASFDDRHVTNDYVKLIYDEG